MSTKTLSMNIGCDEDQEELALSLMRIAQKDIQTILQKNREYGSSWKKRGGVGAFMMLARKWDRLEPQVEKHNYDIIEAMNTDTREEGVIDDIRDLRAYLFLVQTEKKESVYEPIRSSRIPETGVKLLKKEFVSHGYQPEIDGD